MRIFLSFAAIVAAAASLYAADTPPLAILEETGQPTVVETGKLLTLQDSSRKNTERTPAGALAAQVARRGVLYEWVPSADQTRITGGADLVDAFLSPDETLLVLLENVGGKTGPNSTRILCWNLLNNQLVAAFTVPERKLATALPIPGSTRIVAIQQPQEELEQPAALLVIDLKDGTIVQESKAFLEEARSIAVTPTQTFVAVKGDDNIRILRHHDFAGEPGILRTLAPTPRLQLSPGGSTLLIYGEDRAELLSTPDGPGVPELTSTVELSNGFQPVSALLSNDKGDSLILADASGKAILFANGLARPLTERFTGAATCRVTDQKLFLGTDPNEAISFYQLPNETTPTATVSPASLRPRNRGRVFRLFALTGSGSGEPNLILVDHLANIYRLSVLPRRWQKEMIFTAP